MRSASVALHIQPISAMEAHERWLSDAERSRAARFTSEPARLAFIAGRTLVRCVLGQAAGCPPEEVAIVISKTGRPELDRERHPEGPWFSLSHSARTIALGVSTSPVGVDIEAEDRRADAAKLSRRILGANESGLLERVAADKAMFLAVWTAKEAAAKAAGTGLRFDPRRFQLLGHPLAGGAPIAVHYEGRPEFWVRSIAIAGEICSVASTEQDLELDLRMAP